MYEIIRGAEAAAQFVSGYDNQIRKVPSWRVTTVHLAFRITLYFSINTIIQILVMPPLVTSYMKVTTNFPH